MKRHPIRIVEIHIHRSKKNKKLGHAVAKLFPCDHNKYLGLTLYKGDDTNSNSYRTTSCRIIKIEDYDVMDKEPCKLCPQDEFWIDDLESNNNLNDFVDVLESVEDW
jgi:hypothetical protein